MSAHCSHCTLATAHCICRLLPAPQAASATLALLLHPNEPARMTNTAPMIEQCLDNCLHFIWHRREPPTALLALINDPAWQPWLIFPADRPELAERASPWQPVQGKRPLFILPDGTWKEVRKMVRQSPWLQQLPILAFDPAHPSRYQLRRNPDADHLCTAEVARELLDLSGNSEAALAVDQALELFLHSYHRWQHHLAPVTASSC